MEFETKQVPPLPVLSRRERLTIPQIPARSGPAIHSLIESLKQLGIQAAGSMIYVYHGCNGNPAVEFDLEICLPVPTDLDPSLAPEPPIKLKTTTPFRCLTLDYVGPMSGIGQAWMKLLQPIRDGGYKPTDESREIYKKWVSFDSADNVTELQQGIE